MFVVKYPPNDVYAVMGNPRKHEIVKNIVQPESEIAKSLLPVCEYLGHGSAYMEIYYFPIDHNGPIELQPEPNSFIFQLLGQSLVDGETAHPSAIHSMKTNIVIAQSMVYSPCVFVRISMQNVHQAEQPAPARKHSTAFTPIPVDKEKVNFIMVKDDVLTAEECNNIIRSLRNTKNHNGEILIDAENNVTAYDGDIRSVNLMRSKEPDMVNDILERLIVKHVESFYETTMEFWNSPVLLKYDTGDFFIPHVDSETYRDGKWMRIYDRDYTLVCFLNDDYVGGELSFPDYEYDVKPKKGRLVVFPGGHTFRHGASETKSGTRYQLVSWLTAYGTPRTRTPPNPDVRFRRWKDTHDK